MAQPTLATYFNARKRAALDEPGAAVVKKVLILDEGVQQRCEKTVLSNANKKSIPATTCERKVKKVYTRKKVVATNLQHRDVGVMLNRLNARNEAKEIEAKFMHKTPPNSPTKNAMDKVDKSGSREPNYEEIKQKLTRSKRLAELRESIDKFRHSEKKLQQAETKTDEAKVALDSFKKIEVEVLLSPTKTNVDKSYLSPKKDLSSPRRLLMSPTKTATTILSPSKTIESTGLVLPYKYRYVAELFRAIDTIGQIMFNRKETITFRRLKPAVEQMIKKNLLEKHLGQIATLYPDAYTLTQQKLKVFGEGMKKERWELVITPKCVQFDSQVLLERRRKMYHILIEKIKDYHEEFLASLDPPMEIPKGKITRWHPAFDVEQVPDVTAAEIPRPPDEVKLTTGKEVLEKARALFDCNEKMERALERLKRAQQDSAKPREEEIPTKPAAATILKGIPKALLEKVRQKQAAKALEAMTRSDDKEKQVQQYSRLPEIARLTRNLFVAEKKSVLPIEVVIDKLSNSYRVSLSNDELKELVSILVKEVPHWLALHEIRNVHFLKIVKHADMSSILNRLENLAKKKQNE